MSAALRGPAAGTLRGTPLLGWQRLRLRPLGATGIDATLIRRSLPTRLKLRDAPTLPKDARDDADDERDDS
jgi:hypothetical protein